MKRLRDFWVNRPDARNVLILLIGTAILWLPRLEGMLDLRWDASVYYILGTSMAEGKGYRLLSEPGEIQAIQYPPLLPAIVAAHQIALGSSDPEVVGRALRLSYLILSLMYTVAVYGLARQFVDRRFALVITAITQLNLSTVMFSNMLFAEIPYAFATVVFAILNRSGGGRTHFLATSATGIAAYLLRSTGIALLAAWVVEALADRRWRLAALRGAIALIPILAWQGYVGGVKSGEEYREPAYAYQRAGYQYYNVSYAENLKYIDPFDPDRGLLTPLNLAQRVLTNALIIPTHLGESIIGGKNARILLEAQPFHPGLIPALLMVIATVSAGLITLAGLGVMLARREWYLPAYMIFSVAIVCVTPWETQFTRYLTPLTPFAVLSFCEGMIAISRLIGRIPGRGWQYLGPTAILPILWLGAAKDAYSTLRTFRTRIELHSSHPPDWGVGVDHLYFIDAGWAGFEEAAAWIAESTRPEDIVATSTPQWIYLRSGRKAVMPPMLKDPALVQQLLEAVPAKYLIIDNLTHAMGIRTYLKDAVENFPDRWELVLQTKYGETQVYRRARSDGLDSARGRTRRGG